MRDLTDVELTSGRLPRGITRSTSSWSSRRILSGSMTAGTPRWPGASSCHASTRPWCWPAGPPGAGPCPQSAGRARATGFCRETRSEQLFYPLGKPSKKKKFVTGGVGPRVFVTNKKNSQNDFWAILSIFGVFSFSPFFLGGGANPKAGGWILDFAGDVVISRGCSLNLVSPSMIWQCSLGRGVGGACGEKNYQKWLKSDFQKASLILFKYPLFLKACFHSSWLTRPGPIRNPRYQWSANERPVLRSCCHTWCRARPGHRWRSCPGAPCRPAARTRPASGCLK